MNTCLDGEKELYLNSFTETKPPASSASVSSRRFDQSDAFILSRWGDECHRHLTHHLGKHADACSSRRHQHTQQLSARGILATQLSIASSSGSTWGQTSSRKKIQSSLVERRLFPCSSSAWWARRPFSWAWWLWRCGGQGATRQMQSSSSLVKMENKCTEAKPRGAAEPVALMSSTSLLLSVASGFLLFPPQAGGDRLSV